MLEQLTTKIIAKIDNKLFEIKFINSPKKLISINITKKNHLVVAFLAKKYSANVTAITISKKQYEKAKQKIYDDKLTDKVDVKLLDYRNISGKYDKIFSIEMFEAVGEKYWSKYFDVLRRFLGRFGKLLVGLSLIDSVELNIFRS